MQNPKSYRVEITRAAAKHLKRLANEVRTRIVAAIDELAENPRPHQAKKLSGEDAYRIRVGDYRIIYEIADSVLIVLVIRIGHRREVYR